MGTGAPDHWLIFASRYLVPFPFYDSGHVRGHEYFHVHVRFHVHVDVGTGVDVHVL
jgi:hypothetical protein